MSQRQRAMKVDELRGLLVVDGNVKILIEAIGTRGVDEFALRNLAEWALEHCPVADAVGSAVEVKLEIQ